jgi:hypothetical protein
MLMGILQNPAAVCYCGRDAFTEAPIFTKMIIEDKHEFITKLLHVV